MALPSSPPIRLSQVRSELNAGLPFSMNSSAARNLAEQASGTVTLSDFLGKSAGGGGGGGGGGGASSFIGTAASGSSGTSSFSISSSFGAANSERRIVCGIHWAEGGTHRTLSSASIGGVNATIHIQRGHSGGSTGLGAAIISAAVPNGGSGNIVLNFNNNVSTVRAAVYRLVDFNASPTDTDSDEALGFTEALSVTVTVPADGIVIAAYTGSTNTSGTEVLWNAGATERYDLSQSVRMSGAYIAGLGAQSREIVATQGVIADSGNALCVATWT